MKHVPHLYLPGPWDGPELTLTASQQKHLSNVLRLDKGSPANYTDGLGRSGLGVWNGPVLNRGDETEVSRPSDLVMAVAPPANKERARFVVEKLAELGIRTLVWLATSYGNRRLPSKSKQEAWAISALEQSRGSWLLDIEDQISSWSALPTPLAVCQPGGGVGGPGIRTVAIGPEGGFEPNEYPEDAELVDLGPTILRVETAALVAATKFR